MRVRAEELKTIKERMKPVMGLRTGEGRVKITVQTDPESAARDGRSIVEAFVSLVKESGADDVIITTGACGGGCEKGPRVSVETGEGQVATYEDMSRERAGEIFAQDVLSGMSGEEYSRTRGRPAGEKESLWRANLMVCAGTGCVSNSSLRLREVLEEEIEKQNLQEEVRVVLTGCNGFCANGPIMVVQPDGIFYQLLEEKDIPRLVESHLVRGIPVEDYMYRQEEGSGPVPKMHDIGFFSKQQLIALSNRGMVDPENIDEYIGRNGYSALARALTSMTPEEVIEEIKKSGLRGRGGGGFPTGRKWEICRGVPGDAKYLICNADEGDPGAFMDRSIVESDPHAVLEGMIIGGYAIGSAEGMIYIRDEYPLALTRLSRAIDAARDYGLLGEDILGSGFAFDVTINRGAGAFVCGEETSLIQSLEGENPEPRTKPPFPAQYGFLGKPTNINNVETWATVPHIINRSSGWFSSIGTETSKGTKVFSLVGKVKNNGLVEVPMGITMREVVFDIGGGLKEGKKFKAVQIGGPSGGCIPEHLLDTPIDYQSLTEAGAIMGSGGLIVMDEDNCMVEVARYFLSFTQDESCGKCPPCREGTRHMYNLLTNITMGEGREGDVELLESMAKLIKATAICGLGKTAPNPVLTTIRYFRDEYEAHIREHRCPARVCKPLITFTIVEEDCTGCHACGKNCPTGAITGDVKQVHRILQEKCIKCGMCSEVCRFNAVRYE
jgi:NADH:ubiquinone oxidoreductase subunit F (NADH-binding)/(2Fe-2S) ferredoxin